MRRWRTPIALTLRGYWWTVAVVACLAQLLTMGLVTVGIGLASAGGGVAGEVRSQQLTVAGLRQDLLEQEAGISGYAASADARRLAPYTQGRKDMDAALQRLRQQTAGAPSARRLALLESAANGWQLWAEAMRERVARSGRPVRDAAAEQEGELLLARFTTAADGLASELDGAQREAASDEALGSKIALVSLLVGSVLVGALLTGGMARALSRSVKLAQGLAEAAREVARTGQVRIPYADRSDEIGELSRALQAWQSASAEREVMIRQAPIGICRLDPDRTVVTASPEFARMLGLPLEQVTGQPFRSFLHPEDLDPHRAALADLTAGKRDRVDLENRYIQADGGFLWCSTIGAPLRGSDGRPEGFIAIVEDISQRKQLLERAAEIQRGLLPQTTPRLDGYDLAGACRPAEDVAGDFYDWTLSEDGCQLDLTVADVMGKGVGPGLVMATMRAVLRAAPRELAPAARVRLAAEFLTQGAGEDGLFVTMFHGRLDLATGVLRYVDAGHGYGVVRRADGELVHLTERSLPLGIWPDWEFVEGTVRLERGDTLIVYSDGLVETDERVGDLSDHADDLAEAADAREMVWRLMHSLPGHTQDDVTTLALRRAPLAAARPAAGRLPIWQAALAEIEAGSRPDQGGPSGERSRPSDTAPPEPESPVPPRAADAPVTASAGPRLFGFLPARTQREAAIFEGALGVSMHLLMVGLVTVGIFVGSLGSGATDDVRSQQLTVAGLRQDLLQQQIGISGYAASADARQLGPYTQGRRDMDAALQRLRQQTAGAPSAGRVALVESAAKGWQLWAEAMRERVARSGRPVSDAAAEQEGDLLLARFTTAAEGLASELDGTQRDEASDQANGWKFALVALLVGSVLVAAETAVGITSSQLMGGALGSLAKLAKAAREISRRGQVRIPDVDRSDEFGELARALQAWQSASTEREVMIQQAPLGICRLDREGRITEANVALSTMFGHPERALPGRSLLDLVRPEDREMNARVFRGLADGTLDHAHAETRCVRANGSSLWCSTMVAALLGSDGRPEGFIAILEDISQRKQFLEQAARIQRGLLPQTTPRLDGYDLAGTCRPAEDVAGDFYDWTLLEGGQLDLTLADVMGKGVGQGLVMATVRAVLRAAPQELAPAARVRLAAEFLIQGAGEDGVFVTMFHGRLDLATGTLRYVDAGHGYAEVRRAGGERSRLTARSLPLGVWPDQEFVEGTIRLEPGDTLIVYSDGLVKAQEPTGDVAVGLAEPADADGLVWRLMRGLPDRLHDDVTVLALHRAPEPASQSAADPALTRL